MAMIWGGGLPRVGTDPIGIAPAGAGPMSFDRVMAIDFGDGPATQTVVSDYTALLSGRTWNGMAVSDHPAIVTYSFSAAAQPYLSAAGFTNDFIASFGSFSEADKMLARSAMAKWADASGIIAIEAPAGLGDIQFGRFDFSEEPVMDGFHGYAFYPNVNLGEAHAGEGALGGDVFIDDTAPNRAWLMLHEIGHALGFKHSFAGDPTLDPSLDNQTHTVMSYTGSEPGILGDLDHDAVEYLYGLASSDGDHVSSWSWDAATATLTQNGTGANDALRGVYSNDVMSGGAGDDQLLGGFGADDIDGNTGDDFLFGWDGSDEIKGGRGADRLDGGSGADVFGYARARDSTGSGYDTIVAFDALDADAINVAAKVRAVEATIDEGALSNGSFNADLQAAITHDAMHARTVVLFVPDAGTLAGQTFLVIDLNREAGYQMREDLVLRLDGAVNIGSLDPSDFI